MHRQSETRAGNHQSHTRTRNASLPTQANHTARGARKQPPTHMRTTQLASCVRQALLHGCKAPKPARHGSLQQRNIHPAFGTCVRYGLSQHGALRNRVLWHRQCGAVWHPQRYKGVTNGRHDDIKSGFIYFCELAKSVHYPVQQVVSSTLWTDGGLRGGPVQNILDVYRRDQ